MSNPQPVILTRYFGRECSKHPKLAGERMTSDRRCVECSRTRTEIKRKKKNDQLGSRYFGKICDKHPELKGERRTANSSCVACCNARTIASRQKRRKSSGTSRFFGEVCVKHPELNGERSTTSGGCVGCRCAYVKKSRSKTPQFKVNVRFRRQYISKHATPLWSDKTKITKIYERRDKRTEATGRCYTVDHIIPLKGELVCGLHVHNNLRVILSETNVKKGNNYSVNSRR